MTTIESIIHLATALLPTLGVLAFLLLHRRQSIQADLEDTRLRQQHCELADAERSKRTTALAHMAAVFAPTLRELVERAFPRPPAAAELSDEDLIAELDRRVDERGWKHGNPFSPLDDLLERMWADGVEFPPRTGTPPPTSNPSVPPS
ncbi:MAG TPA: hypothetical protein VK034_15195 [Enhygromyxa sp.]|nr:hypothetical protein [Enhygromyxa sp.]